MYRYTDKELDLMGRLLRAEAVGEGPDGMLKVGNVVNNRIKATCDVFKNLTTLNQVIYQRNAFAAINSPLFNGSRATTKEKDLAKKSFRGHKLWPSTRALWFHSMDKNDCRPTWFNQPLTGKYKNHCFYRPKDDCSLG